MNPFTKQLLEKIDDERLAAWVKSWDSFEEFVISINRAKRVTAAQRQDYQRLKDQLLNGYDRWSGSLESHWRGREAAGKALQADPFRLLLSAEHAEEFVDNWRAMQLLPAAREALNRFLMARVDDQNEGEND